MSTVARLGRVPTMRMAHSSTGASAFDPVREKRLLRGVLGEALEAQERKRSALLEQAARALDVRVLAPQPLLLGTHLFQLTLQLLGAAVSIKPLRAQRSLLLASAGRRALRRRTALTYDSLVSSKRARALVLLELAGMHS